MRWRNFLSTGDKFTEVALDQTKHTLIVGSNGTGKSTMLDALSFALFGSPHRNINKPQLVNSINKKNCEVQVEFEIGRSKYKIVRGISPAIFEIWKNNNLINQNSHSKEYQKLLEQNILKLNHKSFHQVVVLGSSSFIPFMQLPQGHRRAVIEDLLDINVFSKMNMLLRERNSILKESIKELSHKIELNDSKRSSQKKYIRDLNKVNNSYRKEKEDQIKDLQELIKKIQDENSVFVKKVETTKPDVESGLKLNHNIKQTLLQDHGQLTSEIKLVVQHAMFYEDHSECPTCRQEISDKIKMDAIKDAKLKAKALQVKKTELAEKGNLVEAALKEYEAGFKEITALQNKINSNIQQITTYQKSIVTIETELSKLTSNNGDLAKAQVDLEKLDDERNKLVDEKFKSSEEYSYNSVKGEMLKDSGIKTKVIKQYIPVINKLVNQYLQVLDFFVSFQLDEQFVEEIRSRYRDTFSYDSFSEGEKQRIDLSLLFTWRQVAKMKNSVSTNLLILDETFDASLDHEGVENLMKILYTLSEDTNVFVISHKGDILEGKFEKKIEFKKEHNFSVMK